MSNRLAHRRPGQFRRFERGVGYRYRRGLFTSSKATDADVHYFEQRAERRALRIELHQLIVEQP